MFGRATLLMMIGLHYIIYKRAVQASLYFSFCIDKCLSIKMTYLNIARLTLITVYYIGKYTLVKNYWGLLLFLPLYHIIWCLLEM